MRSTLKGSQRVGEAIVISRLFSEQELLTRGSCGTSSVEVGKTYVALLWEPIPGATVFDLVEPTTSVKPSTGATLAAIGIELRKQHPTSAWQAGPSSTRTRLVVYPYAQPGEVDLFVLVRNVGTGPVDFISQTRPEADQSSCSLRILDPSQQMIAPRDVPIPKAEIVAYFSKFGRRYTVKLEPGQDEMILLQRVTTATPGWGYKEDLGFVYYPPVSHGPHTVSADCVNVLGLGSHLRTSSLTVTL